MSDLWLELEMTTMPNHARGCVKTPALNFGNDQFLVMSHFVKMSRRIRWPENEFSHSLALQRTRPSRSGCNRSVPWAGSLSLGR